MRHTKPTSRRQTVATLKEASYVLAFPLFMLIWAVQSYQ